MTAIHRHCGAAVLATLLSIGAGESGAGTWDIDTVATTGNVGRECTIERDGNGDLHVACIRYDTGEIVYIARIDGTWQPATTVSSPANYMTGCDIHVDAAGATRFSWSYPSRYSLMYAGPEPANTWVLGDIDSGPDNVGQWLSLHQHADSVLSVSCLNTTQGSLVFSERDASGTWGALETIDPGPQRGTHSSHVYRPGPGTPSASTHRRRRPCCGSISTCPCTRGRSARYAARATPASRCR